MVRIKVFRTSNIFASLSLGIGALLLLAGIVLIITAITQGFNTQFPSGDWNSVIFTIQGFLFLIMGIGYKISRKYFIEWDEDEIRYLLPATKKLEAIKFADIHSVRVKLFEIELQLAEGTRNLDLSNLQFKDLKKIKERFESLKGVRKDL